MRILFTLTVYLANQVVKNCPVNPYQNINKTCIFLWHFYETWNLITAKYLLLFRVYLAYTAQKKVERGRPMIVKETRRGRKNQVCIFFEYIYWVLTTAWVRFFLYRENRRDSACHYLIFIHSTHCFWITGCPPFHSSLFFITRPVGHDLLRHQNTFRKLSCNPCVLRQKIAFIIVFTFNILYYISKQ